MWLSNRYNKVLSYFQRLIYCNMGFLSLSLVCAHGADLEQIKEWKNKINPPYFVLGDFSMMAPPSSDNIVNPWPYKLSVASIKARVRWQSKIPTPEVTSSLLSVSRDTELSFIIFLSSVLSLCLFQPLTITHWSFPTLRQRSSTKAIAEGPLDSSENEKKGPSLVSEG